VERVARVLLFLRGFSSDSARIMSLTVGDRSFIITDYSEFAHFTHAEFSAAELCTFLRVGLLGAATCAAIASEMHHIAR
jgi:hypothetical protein